MKQLKTTIATACIMLFVSISAQAQIASNGKFNETYVKGINIVDFETIMQRYDTANAQISTAEKIKETYIKGINTGGINTGAVDVIMQLYNDDTSIRNTDGSIVSGLDNIKAQYTDFLENGKYTITLENKEVTALGENYLFERGSYELTQTDKDNAVTTGEFVNVLKKVGDQWKIYKSYRYSVAD